MNSGNIVEPRTHTARPTIALPIKIRDQVIGVVKLSKPREAGRWTADEIDLMETIGDQLSVALESARLYEETRRRAERERLTSEITARIRASNDPSAILQTAVRELRQALQADRAQIMLQVSHSSTGGRKSEEEPQVGKIAPPESADSQAAQEKTNE
jgi:GAF domain-containing protein